ncbi:hypothetical protein DL93DRAFT_2233113 [Clavulina sp. PMI_390]|nr:hypothetical protein DL93DRAFT_2233113 [Clavulina sp. PMI_390]
MELYIDNVNNRLYDNTILRRVCNALYPAFCRVSVLEIYTAAANDTPPPLPSMPKLRRLLVYVSHNFTTGWFEQLLPFISGQSSEMTLVRDLVLREVFSSIPSQNMPSRLSLESLTSLELVSRAIFPEWSIFAETLVRCQSLLTLILRSSHSILYDNPTIVTLPNLKALEADNRSIRSYLKTPTLRCLCHYPDSRYLPAWIEPSVIYLRMLPPRNTNYPGYFEELSRIDQLRILELTTDADPYLSRFIRHVFGLWSSDTHESVARPQRIPRLRALIIRRARKDGYVQGRRSPRDINRLYVLAMQILQYHPNLTIYNAELYDFIESDPWAQTQNGLAKEQNPSVSSESEASKIPDLPERRIELESRIRDIHFDSWSPQKSHSQHNLGLTPAMDRSRALWDRLFASSIYGQASAHPRCDLPIREVWQAHES